MTQASEERIRRLESRVNRLYAGIYAIGVVAAFLGAFGISLKFDLAAAQVEINGVKEVASNAKADLKKEANRLAREQVASVLEVELSAILNVVDSWDALQGEVAATLKLGDVVRLTTTNPDYGPDPHYLVAEDDTLTDDQDMTTTWQIDRVP